MKWESIQFPSLSEVLAVHEAVLEDSGGTSGTLKPDGLESAVMAPQATFGGEPLLKTMADLAAAYAFYLATSHVFADGNKRTAYVVAETFLRVNDHPISNDDDNDDAWVSVMEKVARGRISREQLAEVFAAAMGAWGSVE